jgi:hypothetical protein
MGMSLFRNCSTNYTAGAPAPNPDPKRWVILDRWTFPRGYVLKVRYLDCTNFEGIKIMVYRGKFSPPTSLDPHFSDDPAALSPIARFPPTLHGTELAFAVARML